MNKDASQTILHNSLSAEITKLILTAPLQKGGTFQDSFVILESIVVGIMLAAVHPDEYEKFFELITTAIRTRLRELQPKIN